MLQFPPLPARTSPHHWGKGVGGIICVPFLGGLAGRKTTLSNAGAPIFNTKPQKHSRRILILRELAFRRRRRLHCASKGARSGGDGLRHAMDNPSKPNRNYREAPTMREEPQTSLTQTHAGIPLMGPLHLWTIWDPDFHRPFKSTERTQNRGKKNASNRIHLSRQG